MTPLVSTLFILGSVAIGIAIALVIGYAYSALLDWIENNT
jgi:hypothetical protein